LNSKSSFSNSTSKSYAIALYELSKENALLDKVEEEIKSLDQLMKDSSDFKEMIISPTIAKESKKKVIYEPVKLDQEYRSFNSESPWEGTKYIQEDEKKEI